jgi:hypothetical protein
MKGGNAVLHGFTAPKNLRTPSSHGISVSACLDAIGYVRAWSTGFGATIAPPAWIFSGKPALIPWPKS